MVEKLDPLLLSADQEYEGASHQALTAWAEGAIQRFLSSSHCSSWSKDQRDTAGFFLHGFIDCAYGYELAKPFQYDEELVREICLSIFPRKMSTKEEDFKLVAPVLSAFFQWCEDEGVLNNAASLIQLLKKIDRAIYKAAKDPSNWGMAKSLFSGF